MATLQAVAKSVPLFPYLRWNQRLSHLASQYHENQPIPHIFLWDFLEPEIASTIAKEFPDPHSEAWTHYQHQNENKLGLAKRERFPVDLGTLVDELNSPDFVEFLSELTGIPGLMADP